jgi:hypothetical protein
MKTLHIIDIENIFGGPLQGDQLFNNSKDLYEQIIRINSNDEVLIASNPELFMNLLNSWAYDSIEDQWIGDITSGDLFSKFTDITFGNTLSIFSRPGKDGADIVLNEEALNKFEEYDRIVVASGDHYFLDLCHKALKRSKKLVIVSTQHGLSNVLKAIPCEKITFEIQKNQQENFGFKWKTEIGSAA